MRKIQGHADIVTDFAFSPFDDGLIATGSQDQTIKLWRLPQSLTSDITEAELELPEQPRRVETVSWHPLADGLLVSIIIIIIITILLITILIIIIIITFSDDLL